MCPLTPEEWWAVMKISLPVILLDEALKFVARKFIDGNKRSTELIYLISAWVAYFALLASTSKEIVFFNQLLDLLPLKN